jgi:ribosomal protein L11 methyltransferase
MNTDRILILPSDAVFVRQGAKVNMNDMDWLEVAVEVDGEAAEAVSEVFNRHGRGGAVIEHTLLDGLGAHDQADRWSVKTYIPVDDPALRHKIEEALWHLGQLYPIPEPQFRVVAEQDWSEAWKAHYRVVRVGERTVIVPQWLSYDPKPGEIVLLLDPGMAFGTGTHPTTRLCLEAIEGLPLQGQRVLDVGTGSGILAIAAAKWGAAEVVGVDVDELAVASAGRNVAANGVASTVRISSGSLDGVEGTYDVVLVNILARVICALLEQGLVRYLAPGGTIVASGIVDTQEGEVREAMAAQGIEVVGRSVERDWVALLGRVPAAEEEAP